MSRAFYAIAKRALDVTVSGTALVLTLPVSAVIAALVKSEDGGPVFFRQPRAGQDGVPFEMLKFRTMRVDQPGSAGDAYAAWDAGVPDDFVFKTSGSSSARITRVGRLLRRTSLDELPQLLNVLTGEMTLVGPRPEILPIASRYNAEQARRLAVRPGVTGLAQVTGRSSHNHGQKIDADLRYVDSASLLLDLRIILRTLLVPFHGRGAF
jgi:lipopolysaccharide/colanic/teichoic acid biosynthesis glycosyltransferase